MNAFKLGPFCLTGDEPVQNFIDAGVKIAKVINNPGLANALHDGLGDKVTIIARTTIQGDDFERAYNHLGLTDPKGAALRWWNDMQFQIAEAPFAYWESWNEFANWEHLPQFGIFEAERQRIMADHGMKACVGNFSAGCPPVGDFAGDSREDVWLPLYPMLEACHKYGNLLGLHEYASLWLSLWYGAENQHADVVSRGYATFPDTYEEGWLAFRYRKVWRRHIVPNGWTNIRIALTEYGLDRAGVYTTDLLTDGANAGPWRQSGHWWDVINHRPDSEQYYLQQLRWAEYQMQRDSYLVGATIFCWGTDDPVWKEWDVRGNVGGALLADMKASGYPPSARMVTAPPGLNLRTHPALDAAAIAVLPLNEIVEAIEETDGWTRLRTASGRSGFAMSRWLQHL